MVNIGFVKSVLITGITGQDGFYLTNFLLEKAKFMELLDALHL